MTMPRGASGVSSGKGWIQTARWRARQPRRPLHLKGVSVDDAIRPLGSRPWVLAQAREHTAGLGVSVRSLESLDLQGGTPEEIDDFNLLFVSIAAWHKLTDEHEVEVSQYFLWSICDFMVYYLFYLFVCYWFIFTHAFIYLLIYLLS